MHGCRVQQCIDDNVFSSLPPAGETVARLTPRLTAGVGVLVAFLLLGASPTEAVADPGRSHSDRGNSSDRSNGNGNGRGGSHRGDDHRRGDDDNRKRGEDDGHGSAERGGAESPRVQSGSGPLDLADLAELAPSLAAGESGAGDGIADPGLNRVGVADVAELAPSLAADSDQLRSSGPDASEFGGLGAADSPDRSGSNGADVPKARFSPPRLTLGNGSAPAIRRGESEPRLQAPALQPAPAAPPVALAAPLFRAPAPPPAFVNPLPSAPVLTQQLGVSQDADWSDPLWGLTGLLLIPAAGAILGYRQARAAHAADGLRRS
jgi:hypothetical protein